MELNKSLIGTFYLNACNALQRLLNDLEKDKPEWFIQIGDTADIHNYMADKTDSLQALYQCGDISARRIDHLVRDIYEMDEDYTPKSLKDLRAAHLFYRKVFGFAEDK
jgi:hypothetical protein